MYLLRPKVHSRKDNVGTICVNVLKIIRYLSLYVWEYCAKLQAVTGDLTTKVHSHRLYFGKRTDVNNWAGSSDFGGWDRTLPSPAAQLITALGMSTAALSQLPDLLLGVGVQLARGNWKNKINIKMGKQIQGRKECGDPEQKLQLGHVSYEGGLQQNELAPSLTVKRGNWEQKCLLPPLMPGWPYSFIESLLWWLTYLCAYLTHQDTFKSEELCLLPKQEALMTHVLDKENVMSCGTSSNIFQWKTK